MSAANQASRIKSILLSYVVRMLRINYHGLFLNSDTVKAFETKMATLDLMAAPKEITINQLTAVEVVAAFLHGFFLVDTVVVSNFSGNGLVDDYWVGLRDEVLY